MISGDKKRDNGSYPLKVRQCRGEYGEFFSLSLINHLNGNKGRELRSLLVLLIGGGLPEVEFTVGDMLINLCQFLLTERQII